MAPTQHDSHFTNNKMSTAPRIDDTMHDNDLTDKICMASTNVPGKTASKQMNGKQKQMLSTKLLYHY